MNKRKIFAAYILVPAIITGIAACGKAPPPESSPPESGVYSEPYIEESTSQPESSRPPTVEDDPGIIENLPSGEVSDATAPSEAPPLPEPKPEPLPQPLTDTPKPAVTPDSDISPQIDEGKIERELLKLINAERTAVGAEPLGEEENMRFAARIRASEALEKFSHTRPDGSPYNTAFDEAGFTYAGKWHGENLASLRFTDGMLDEAGAALEMFTGLKSSPGHYSNMTSNRFLHSGIGVSLSFESGMVSIASAQMFSSI